MSSLPVTLFDKKNGDDLTDINGLASALWPLIKLVHQIKGENC